MEEEQAVCIELDVGEEQHLVGKRVVLEEPVEQIEGEEPDIGLQQGHQRSSNSEVSVLSAGTVWGTLQTSVSPFLGRPVCRRSRC